MKNKIIHLLFLFSPFVFLYAQPDLSGRVVYPDSVGIDLIRVEVWQNNQQLASTITDSLGYFEIDSIITGVNNISNPVPSSFELYPNYPSPFDKTTNIIYEIDKPEEISITIYNSIGQEITTLTSGYRQKGFYVAQWDGRNSFGNEVAQGIYFARLDNGKEARFVKLLKMNGALNATGTTIPGNFYKGSNVNEDYLVKFIDINIINRVDYAEITIPLPAQIHQILYEKFTINQYIFYSYEGDTLTVSKNNWTYGTGPVQSFENLSPDWQMWDDSTSIYFTTLDPNVNGQEEITLRTIATHNTTDTSTIVVNIFETTTWQGQFVDDMKYKKLLGIIEPEAGLRAEIKVDNQSFFTDNEGYFNIRLTPSANYTVKVQGIEESGDTTTFQHTFELEGIDQSGLIFHAAPYWPVFQMNLPLSEGYIFAWVANFAPGPGANYPGMKIPNWDSTQHSLYPLSIFSSDTMSLEEMEFIKAVLDDSIHNYMQIPLPVVYKSFEDTANLNGTWGEILWWVDRTGPAGAVSTDYGSNGILYNALISVRGGTPAWKDAILQEGASPIFGPYPVFSQTFWGKTVLSQNGNPAYITLLDRWLLRIIENYEPLDDIDDILGF